MRHRKAKLTLNRFTSWRKATLRSLATSLFTRQSIRTTYAKAKAVVPLVERLISLSKANTLSAKRRAASILNDHKLVSLLFNKIGPRFTNRIGGYTKIINLCPRRGDNARMVILELTELKKKEPKKPRKEKEVRPEEEKKHEPDVTIKEKPPIVKKPTKKFFGGLRNIFKKERDSL